MSEKLEAYAVTQADREAAADFMANGDETGLDAYLADHIRSGNCDDGSAVQAFARHRLAHSTPANGEQVERVARAIYEEDDPWHKAWAWPDLNPEAQGGATAADRYRDVARAAIAAMDPTPTQDARERIKVLEEALGPFAALAETYTVSTTKGLLTLTNGERMCGVKPQDFQRARTALGNQEERL